MNRQLRQMLTVLAALCALAGTCVPAVASRGARQRATIATYYGPGFYGHLTACGQRLTPQTVGVANRTLPCGTLVRFRYRGHGAVVPVIDRGPYGNATWDLTTGATRVLGIATGVTRVWSKVVGHTANVPSLGAATLEPTPNLALSPTGGVQAR